MFAFVLTILLLGGQDLTADQQLKSSRDALKAGNYEKSIQLSEDAARHFRKSRDARKLANALFISGSSKDMLSYYDAAAIDYLEVLRLKSDNPEINISACKNVAVIYKKFRRFDEAISFNEKGLNLAREDVPKKVPGLLYNIGNLYKEKGMIENAMEAYMQSWELSSESNDFIRLARLSNQIGICLKDQGNHGEAREYYHKIINAEKVLGEDYSKYAGRAYHNIGVTYLESEKYDEAIRYFKKALELKTEPEAIFISWLDMGDAYARLGDTTQAIATWKKALAYYPGTLNPDYYIIYKHLANSHGSDFSQYRKYITLYTDALERFNQVQQKLIELNQDHQFHMNIHKYEREIERLETQKIDHYQYMGMAILLCLILVTPYTVFKIYKWRVKNTINSVFEKFK